MKITEIVYSTRPEDIYDHYKIKIDEIDSWVDVAVDKGAPVDIEGTIENIKRCMKLRS